VNAAESAITGTNEILDDIRQSYSLHSNHYISNVLYQKNMLIKRSQIINKTVSSGILEVKGALYNLHSGLVEFL
jgi:carbonic anhydrase